jgi:hypothetical protein
MMEALRTSETSVDNHFTQQYIPEDNSEHQIYYYAYTSTSRRNLENPHDFVSSSKKKICYLLYEINKGMFFYIMQIGS